MTPSSLVLFLYSLAFPRPLQHQWHKLDNVFSIQCFACLFIYLSCLPTLRAHLLMNFFSMGTIMLLQEKNPWNELYTIVPVLVVVLFFLSVTMARYDNQTSEAVLCEKFPFCPCLARPSHCGIPCPLESSDSC